MSGAFDAATDAALADLRAVLAGEKPATAYRPPPRRYWQATCLFPNGATMLSGVEAPDEDAAADRVAERLLAARPGILHLAEIRPVGER